LRSILSTGKGMKLRGRLYRRSIFLWNRCAMCRRAIRLLKKTLPVPLIGFCGGPYTVCKYMERLTPEWLDKVTEASISYLKMQVDAGADALQIFDSWAGHLEPHDFHTLALPYLARLVKAIKPLGVPMIVFCRGSHRYLSELIALEPAAIGFDYEKWIFLKSLNRCPLTSLCKGI
jgi:uroporphyrinogen decarboxylase